MAADQDHGDDDRARGALVGDAPRAAVDALDQAKWMNHDVLAADHPCAHENLVGRVAEGRHQCLEIGPTGQEERKAGPRQVVASHPNERRIVREPVALDGRDPVVGEERLPGVAAALRRGAGLWVARQLVDHAIEIGVDLAFGAVHRCLLVPVRWAENGGHAHDFDFPQQEQYSTVTASARRTSRRL